MAASPSTPWYWGDWARDTRALDPYQKGVWIEMLRAMHDSPVHGQIKRSWSELAREVGAVDLAELKSAVDRMFELGLFDVVADEASDTRQGTCPHLSREFPEVVTLVSRRMERTRKQREYERLKKQRQRCPENVPGDSRPVPPLPSFSSSFSSSEKRRESSLRSDSCPELLEADSGQASPSPTQKKAHQDRTRDGGKKCTSSPVVLRVPLVRRDGEYEITRADVDNWQDTFPAVDVMSELRVLRNWNLDNPKNRKTRAGFRAHVSRWLGKAQNKAPRVDQGRSPQRLACGQSAVWDKAL